MERIIIFDTSLRDGEQAPGFSMNTQEKLEMARQLARLNVDVIEAGFPISSDEDFEAVREVAKQVGTLEGAPIICGLSRVGLGDIDRAWEAIKYARRSRIHTFVATSDIHLKYKLRKSRAEVLKAAVEAVKHARGYCEDVEFSPEDASRTDFDYMCEVLSAVIDAGARTINIPDTVGYAIPREWAERIARSQEKVHGADRAVISVHCHNDLGQAVANSLAALMSGARQIECTINGIGERAGNASQEGDLRRGPRRHRDRRSDPGPRDVRDRLSSRPERHRRDPVRDGSPEEGCGNLPGFGRGRRAGRCGAGRDRRDHRPQGAVAGL